MARIRSIHPGLFTDEAFVSLSMPARILAMGIWTECDDHGVFEWKPVTLKMKIFPADPVDVAALLDELLAANVVALIQIDGRSKHGAVRNFCQYQKPKKPAFRYPLPDELRTYVGLKVISSPPVENQFPTSGEKSRLMEKEDGVGEGEERKKGAAKAAPKYAFESGIIRLVADDLTKWKKAFKNLDVEAELIGLTQWAGQQRDWFFAVSGALAKRNREVGAAKKKSGEYRTMSGMEGII